MTTTLVQYLTPYTDIQFITNCTGVNGYENNNCIGVDCYENKALLLHIVVRNERREEGPGT